MTNLYHINRYKNVSANFQILSSFIDYTCDSTCHCNITSVRETVKLPFVVTCDRETEKNSPQM